MSSWTSAAAQVRALAKAVSAAFAASNLTDEEKSPGKIEITNLPWQAPPLVTPLMLAGGALQDFFDPPLPFEAQRLHAFWVSTLQEMWFRPSSLLKRGVYVGAGRAMPSVKLGQRAFRFSRPAGWPVCEESAGAVFSLEVAHAASISLPVQDLVSGPDDYYVVLADGTKLGVQAGVPACSSPWVAPVTGMAEELLLLPRGDVSYACEYDQLASLRSVLHVHRSSFPHNFEALDQAMQALRLLSFGGYCPELLNAMRLAPIDMRREREKERAFGEALDVIDADISDRNKLQTLLALLVPEIITHSDFKRHIFAGEQFPFTLARGKLARIREWAEAQYQRLPVELQKGKYAVSKA